VLPMLIRPKYLPKNSQSATATPTLNYAFFVPTTNESLFLGLV